jgi:hypothetical protein
MLEHPRDNHAFGAIGGAGYPASFLRAVAFSAGGDGESGLVEQMPLGVRLGGNLLSRCRCSPRLTTG